MIKNISLILFGFIFVLSVEAQEKSTMFLTGNRTVDFFGSPRFSNNPSEPVFKYLTFDQDQESGHREKNPWLAGLMSLAVPGAGEMYSENFTKGSVFFGIEVASWLIADVYWRKGDKQTIWFKNYANEHYSPIRYAQWVLRNIGTLSPGLDTSTYHFFYRTPDANSHPPFDDLNWAELNRLELKVADFTHRLPYYDEQQYYELIGKYKQFSKGWDSQIGNDADFETGNAQFYSYGVEFNKADHYYTIADIFYSVIVLNHILSALDAFLTASHYNHALHAEVSMKMEPTPYGYLPSAEAKIKYSF